MVGEEGGESGLKESVHAVYLCILDGGKKKSDPFEMVCRDASLDT